jgi:hypothetical protein
VGALGTGPLDTKLSVTLHVNLVKPHSASTGRTPCFSSNLLTSSVSPLSSRVGFK